MWQAIHRKLAQVNFLIVLTHQTHLETACLLTCATSLSSFWGDSEPSRHNIDSARTMPSTRLPSPLFLSPSLPFSWPPCIKAMPPLVLLQLSWSLSENQHNMMNKFCKMMKIFG